MIDVPFVDLVRPMRDPAERTAVGLASVHVEVSLRALRERSLDDFGARLEVEHLPGRGGRAERYALIREAITRLNRRLLGHVLSHVL